MFKTKLIISMVLLLIFASKAYCISKEEIVANLQKIYDNAKDYTADFYQVSEMGSIKRVQKASGKVYFKKSAKMYWEYEQPMRQKVISNGSKMWIYQPDINQVQIFDYSADDMSKTANSFLSGIGKLLKDFDITFKGEEVQGNFVLDMKPKEETLGFVSMKMYINSKSFNIVKTATLDAYGNANTITFKDIKFNTKLTDDFFDFKAPEETVVVTPPANK